MLGKVRRGVDEPPSLQVYRMIAGAISRGTVDPGSRLPPERELSSRVGVSRATLRVALRALHADGLLEPAQGRGWHVVTAPGVVEEHDETPLSFTDMAAARGLRSSARVLRQETRPATIEEAEALGIAPGAGIFCLDRLRRLDEVPVALGSACLPVRVVEPVISLDYTAGSLYAALRERCGITPVRVEYVLEARAATGAEVELLELREGDAVLIGHNKCFDDTGRVFEIGKITYRGDRYRFRTVLRNQRSTAPGEE